MERNLEDLGSDEALVAAGIRQEVQSLGVGVDVLVEKIMHLAYDNHMSANGVASVGTMAVAREYLRAVEELVPVRGFQLIEVHRFMSMLGIALELCKEDEGLSIRDALDKAEGTLPSLQDISELVEKGVVELPEADSEGEGR